MTDRLTDGQTDRRMDRRTGKNNMSPDPVGGEGGGGDIIMMLRTTNKFQKNHFWSHIMTIRLLNVILKTILKVCGQTVLDFCEPEYPETTNTH